MLKLIKRHRQAIKGVAAFIILFYSSWELVLNGKAGVLPYLEKFVRNNCYVGVDIFLLLGGMGLVHSINKNTIKEYYIHRIKRFLFPVLIIGIIYSFVNKWSFFEFLCNVSGITFFVKDTTIFLWFIPAMMTLNILFPLYYNIYNKFDKKCLVTFISISIWLVIVLLVKNYIRDDMLLLINRIPVFLIGIMFGQMLIENKDININELLLAILSIVGILFACYEMHLVDDYQHQILVNRPKIFIPALVISISGSTLLAIIFDKIPVLIKPFNWIGSFSLELYCCRKILLSYIRRLIFNLIPSILVFNIISFTIILFVSFIYKIICDYLLRIFSACINKLFSSFYHANNDM